MVVLRIKGTDKYIHKGSEPHVKLVDLQNATVYHTNTAAKTSLNSTKMRFYLKEHHYHSISELEIVEIVLQLKN